MQKNLNSQVNQLKIPGKELKELAKDLERLKEFEERQKELNREIGNPRVQEKRVKLIRKFLNLKRGFEKRCFWLEGKMVRKVRKAW